MIDHVNENESNDFHFSLAGRVRNLGFAPSAINSLFPLFEAIANGLQAIEDRWKGDASRLGRITIEILRADSDTDHPPVSGFLVTDNGIGLTAENWTAFRTADTGAKILRGGKGVGRLSWLKVFENTRVTSAFQLDGDRHVRTFDFGLKEATQNPISDHKVSLQPTIDEYGTIIKLQPYDTSYGVHCPRSRSIIATQIIGHFLKNFVSYEIPKFTIIDGHERMDLLDYYGENVVSEKTEVLNVVVDGSEELIPFELHHILIKKALKLHDKGKHWLGYVGNGRVVREDAIDGQLGLDYIGEDGDCVYFGLVTSEYLNKHVNQERTRFTFPDHIDKAMHKAAVDAAKVHLSIYIEKVRNLQAVKTWEVIKENPQFLSLTNDVNDFVRQHLKLSTRSDEDIFLELSRQRRRHRQDITRDIKSMKDVSGDDFSERVQKIASAINAEQKGTLAEYVVNRKEILDLLDSSIAYADPELRNYLKEEAVHDLIIPIRSSGDSMDYDAHNLWILDDRLAFYSFFQSDKPFNTFLTESDSRKEPDLAIVFDRSLALERAGLDEPVVIVEFKRPGRTNYGPGDDPVKQVLDYVKILRSGGSYKDRTGKVRKQVPEATRFLCFVIADFTDQLTDILDTSIAQNRSADGEGYFGFSPKHNAFVEVLPYSKLISDARLRNEAFFKKLGLL